MVWGAIKANGSRVLVKYEGTIASQEHQAILMEGLAKIYNPGEIFQHDGASCHTLKSTKKYLQENHINLMGNRSSQSPDLNIIEPL